MVFQLGSLHPLVLQLKQLIVLKKKLNAVCVCVCECVCVSVMGLRGGVGERVLVKMFATYGSSNRRHYFAFLRTFVFIFTQSHTTQYNTFFPYLKNYFAVGLQISWFGFTFQVKMLVIFQRNQMPACL
jgi:hypothetical protein